MRIKSNGNTWSANMVTKLEGRCSCSLQSRGHRSDQCQGPQHWTAPACSQGTSPPLSPAPSCTTGVAAGIVRLLFGSKPQSAAHPALPQGSGAPVMMPSSDSSILVLQHLTPWRFRCVWSSQSWIMPQYCLPCTHMPWMVPCHGCSLGEPASLRIVACSAGKRIYCASGVGAVTRLFDIVFL